MPEYSCDLLTISDTEEAARLYCDVFLSDEPTTRRHAPDPEIFLRDARLYVRYLAANGLCFIAREKDTADIIGFLFCFDMTVDPGCRGEWMERFLGHFQDAVAMIDELEDRYLDLPGLVPGSTLHVFQIGTGRKYRGCGIAASLIRRALANAQGHGFRQAIADCTGAASCLAFKRCGFHPVGFLSYEDFKRDEIRFFRGLEGGITLMVKTL